MTKLPLGEQGGNGASAVDISPGSAEPGDGDGEPHEKAARAPSKAPPSLPTKGDLVGGKYRLESLIARGGMATVWLAYNVTLDVRVAVKFIRADLAGGKDRRLADRLLQEARSTARLGHPAIVRVHDFGKTDRGVPFLVMELLEGESLDVALDRRGRVAARKAVRALLPVAHALAAAHGKGIIHRDLKPENVFMAQTAGGRIQPKLIDFGISKTKQRSGKRLTFVGEAVGTPAYMSPEQAMGEETDHRSDIWAFCVMVYELVTGAVPFQGATITAMARAIIDDAPQPITAFSAGDDQLWAILAKGLAKGRSDRWQTMRELGGELACWLIDRRINEDITGASLEAAWLLDTPANSVKDAFASVPPPRRSSAPQLDTAPPTADSRPASTGGPTSGAVRISGRPSSEPGDAAGELSRRDTQPAARALAPTPETALSQDDERDDDTRQTLPRGQALMATSQTLPSGESVSGPPSAAPVEIIMAGESSPEAAVPESGVAPRRETDGTAAVAAERPAAAALIEAPAEALARQSWRGLWLAVAAAALLVAVGVLIGLLL